MDSHLKERLVGAAVLVAVAVVLIPEMLSGPADHEAGTASVERAAGEGIKTYTIDLGTRARSGADASGEVPTDAVGETAAPPPEETLVAPAAAPPAPATDRPPAKPAPPVDAAPPAAPAVEEPPPAAVARPAQAATLRWAVQVGSFASQATAERLSQDLMRRGYPSFVVPFKPGAQTLYRVRIGPMEERGAADATVQKLKREGTAATVVANT